MRSIIRVTVWLTFSVEVSDGGIFLPTVICRQFPHDGLFSEVLADRQLLGVSQSLQVAVMILAGGDIVALRCQLPEDAAVAGVVVLAVRLSPDQDGGEAGQLLADVLQPGGHAVATGPAGLERGQREVRPSTSHHHLPYLDLLAGGRDVPAELGQTPLRLCQDVQLTLVHQAGDVGLLVSHQQVPLDQVLSFTVFQIFNFL